LNQVEIYFSIVHRKVLSPNDFPSLEALAERLLDFQYYWGSARARSNGNSLAKASPTAQQTGESVLKIAAEEYETVFTKRCT